MSSPRPFGETGDLRRAPTVLEASAGTGKTHAITSLTLRLVAEHGVELPRILVVTFTRKATSELRDRVRRRLAAAATVFERAVAGIAPDPDEDRLVAHLVAEGAARDVLPLWLTRIQVARETLDDATISTIHGFCQQTLHQSAFESGADYDVELVEDVTGILDQITDDLHVRMLRHADDLWHAVLRRHVGRSDLAEIAARVEREPHLRILPTPPEGDADLQAQWTEALAQFSDSWVEGCEDLVAWFEALRADKAFGRTQTYTDANVAGWVDEVSAWCAKPQERLTRLAEVDVALGKLTPPSVAEKLDDEVAADHPLLEQVAAFRELTHSLVASERARFAQRVGAELVRRKRRRNVMSFNDLLADLAAGLASRETRESLHRTIRDRFEAALIDEFQDTDPVQWQIFDALFGDGDWLYLVGDPKQAIYAFRGADVHTYLRAAETVEEEYTLETNWRSDGRYVRALNHLFNRDGVFGHNRIVYRSAVAAYEEDRLLQPDGPAAALRLTFVPREAAGVPDDKPITKRWAQRSLSRHVAADIARFLDSGTRLVPEDGKEPRPVEPGDVAVLVRRHREARAIQEALVSRGVPAVVASAGSVFAATEAESLQRLLDAMIRPHGTAEVRAALATPLFGVDASGLARLEHAGATEWDGWVDDLARWGHVWRERGIAAAVQRVFADRDVAVRLLSRPRGERSLTNVLHLTELLHAAETGGRLGPPALAVWLRAHRAGVDDDDITSDEVELRLESDADAVQVVTVHASKGLEYPVVWCPFLWDGVPLRINERRNLRFHHPDEGELSLDLHVDHEAEPKASHVALAQRERWEEQVRLLYVALTRARHRCVVHWGSFSGAEASPLAWVLHGWRPDESGDPADARKNLKQSDEALRAEIEEIAAGSDGAIEVVTLDTSDAGRTPPEPTDEGLERRRFSRPLDGSWRRTSFTALTRPPRVAADPADPAVDRGIDHDELAGPSPDPAAAHAVTDDPHDQPVPLGTFLRGADAGIFLHGVLEDLDFEDPSALEDVVGRRIERHGLVVEDPAALVAGLEAVLATPLGPVFGGRALADVSRADRLDEVHFDLPLVGGYGASGRSHLHLADVADILDGHASSSDAPYGPYAELLRTARVSPPVRGFLTGSIDLVARVLVDGYPRYVVGDYKSNWLGDPDSAEAPSRMRDYHPQRLAAEMVHHHYILQYLLYLVALHRLLRWRLGPDYDYDRDVGGVVYLFLRGMVGPDTPHHDGQPYGVYADCPPRALVDDLDALFAEGSVR